VLTYASWIIFASTAIGSTKVYVIVSFIKDKFDTIKREPLHIKGKGLMQTYFLKSAES
jgi:hypothetical protein